MKLQFFTIFPTIVSYPRPLHPENEHFPFTFVQNACMHAEGIRCTSQIRSLTIRPRDEYELRRPRAAISALTDRPSLGRETLRFPSSPVRFVADAARGECELPARGPSEKRSFARRGAAVCRGKQSVMRSWSSARRELGEPETGLSMSG